MMVARIRYGVLALSSLLLLSAAGCFHRNPPDTLHVFQGDVFGSTYTIKVVASNEARLSEEREAAIRASLQACFNDVNRTMSTYDAKSELSRFNQSRDTTPQKVSGELIDVLAASRLVSEQSGGAFDVTVAPLVKAWGFGAGARAPGGPSDEELAGLRERVGYRLIEIDRDASTLRKLRPDVSCDVNAIAPGYAVDRVAAALDGLGYQRYMIEIGGEVRTNGVNAEGRPWQIAIERPLTYARAVERVLSLTDTSVSTSGDYRDYYEKDGVRISHTIDPRTGRPIAHALASVTVVHDTCTLADAYATALMVLGPDDGYDLAVRLDLPALFIIHSGPEGSVEKATSAFTRMFPE